MEQSDLIPKDRKPRSDKGTKRTPPMMFPKQNTADESPVLVVINGEPFRCKAWSFEGKFLKMEYWPESRGRQGFRYVALERVWDLQIEQPEGMAPKPAPTWSSGTSYTLVGNAASGVPMTLTGPEPSGPKQYINPLIAGRDPNANVSRIVKLPNDQSPVPKTEIVDENGGRSVVEAAILS